VPSQQQQFPTQRNRRACVGLTANALTVSLVPWQSGRTLVWDVTVVCPLADSYVASAAREARSVAELAATKKEDKYSGLAADYLFQPIAVEILGPINESSSDFLSLLAKKISQRSGDERATSVFPRS